MHFTKVGKKMKRFKIVFTGIFALLIALTSAASAFAATPKGTITFVNTDHNYSYRLYSRNDVVVAEGQVTNVPVFGQYDIGIYRYEIAHGDGRIERGQVTLASGQLLLITANSSTTSISSSPGNTTMNINTGGSSVSYDQGDSSTISNPQVVARQIGSGDIDVVGEVTSAEASEAGIDAILHDRIIPVTGFAHEDHNGAPSLQFNHVTNDAGSLARDYISETINIELAIGNVMCVSAAPARDFEACALFGDRNVVGVIDENGDVIFAGIEQIKVTGNVNYGDKLVASDTPGFAVVDNNAPHGSVIATAMGSFSGEFGLVTASIGK